MQQQIKGKKPPLGEPIQRSSSGGVGGGIGVGGGGGGVNMAPAGKSNTTTPPLFVKLAARLSTYLRLRRRGTSNANACTPEMARAMWLALWDAVADLVTAAAQYNNNNILRPSTRNSNSSSSRFGGGQPSFGGTTRVVIMPKVASFVTDTTTTTQPSAAAAIVFTKAFLQSFGLKQSSVPVALAAAAASMDDLLAASSGSSGSLLDSMRHQLSTFATGNESMDAPSALNVLPSLQIDEMADVVRMIMDTLGEAANGNTSGGGSPSWSVTCGSLGRLNVANGTLTFQPASGFNGGVARDSSVARSDHACDANYQLLGEDSRAVSSMRAATPLGGRIATHQPSIAPTPRVVETIHPRALEQEQACSTAVTPVTAADSSSGTAVVAQSSAVGKPPTPSTLSVVDHRPELRKWNPNKSGAAGGTLGASRPNTPASSVASSIGPSASQVGPAAIAATATQLLPLQPVSVTCSAAGTPRGDFRFASAERTRRNGKAQMRRHELDAELADLQRTLEARIQAHANSVSPYDLLQRTATATSKRPASRGELSLHASSSSPTATPTALNRSASALSFHHVGRDCNRVVNPNARASVMELAMLRDVERRQKEALMDAQMDADQGFANEAAIVARVSSELLRRSQQAALREDLQSQRVARDAEKRQHPNEVLAPICISKPVHPEPFMSSPPRGSPYSGVRSVSALGSHPNDWLAEKLAKKQERRAYGEELNALMRVRQEQTSALESRQRAFDAAQRAALAEEVQREQQRLRDMKEEHRREFVEAWDTQRSASSLR